MARSRSGSDEKVLHVSWKLCGANVADTRSRSAAVAVGRVVDCGPADCGRDAGLRRYRGRVRDGAAWADRVGDDGGVLVVAVEGTAEVNSIDARACRTSAKTLRLRKWHGC